MLGRVAATASAAGLDRFVRVLILESRAPINNQYVVFTDAVLMHASGGVLETHPESHLVGLGLVGLCE